MVHNEENMRDSIMVKNHITKVLEQNLKDPKM